MRIQGVHLLRTSDRTSVESLRQANLVNEGSFVADPAAVCWSESDERSKVFGIYSDTGVLLSSMRAEYLLFAEELPPKLDYDHLHELIPLPCGLLGKAVTRAEYQGRGFNTYLRYLAYEAFHLAGVQYVVGTLMPSAHRVEQLRRLGYQFIENPEGWRRYGYNSFGKTLVCYLDLQKNYEQVLTVLGPKVAQLKRDYPYVQS